MSLPGEAFDRQKLHQVLVNTANWLIKSGKLKESDCPVILDGRLRYIVHTRPGHDKLGKKFEDGKQLSNGLWIERSYNRDQTIRLARILLSRYGVSPDVLTVEQLR